MKKKVFVLFIAAMAVTALVSSGSIQQSANQLYQSGIYKEDVEGKLEEAIAIYQEIIKKFSQEGPVAAKAWFHMGLCYEKLGQEKVKQAQEAFQKVLDTYPGETDMVKVAREKLTILLKAQSATREGGRKMEIRRVLSLRGAYEWHQVSPDGRYIAYIDYGEMETGVVVLELATGETRRLKCKIDEREGTGTSWSFLWSPNGESIACSWWRDDPPREWADLRLLFVDGSAPRRIFHGDYSDVYPFSWSSDGRYILAVFYRGKNQIGMGMIRGKNQIGMGIISTEDGLVRFLETPVRGQLWNMGFSPDGRYVAYDSPRESGSGNRDIFLLSVDERTKVSLITHPANDIFLGWSPDGSHVLFTSDRLGTVDLWAVAVADGRPAKEAEVIRRGIGQMQFAGMTHSGSLYFMTSNVMEDIYILKIEQESGKSVAPPEKMILSEEGINSAPQYSPDGRFLAYLRESESPNATLCVLSLETREERHFPLGTPARLLPHWSPDGRSVYFTSILPGLRWGMFRMDLETGRHSAVAPEKADDSNLNNLFIGCSPDGKSVYYVSKEEDKEVCRILTRNTENGVEQEMFQGECKFAWRSTSISPDGTRLATVSREAQRAIIILPTSGNGASKVLYRFEQSWGGSVAWLAWTPDGRSIIFTKNEGSGSSLWRISADGGDPQNLGITTTKPVSGICIHPDGRRLAFSTSVPVNNRETELWVMEHFLPPGK